MHCLILSDTFPNRLQPWNGPYNRRQAECLGALCRVTAIAPLPWQSLRRDARFRALTQGVDDTLPNVPTYHPRFWYLPVIGRRWSWRGLLAASERALRGGADGPFDVLLATFAYPHGMAARALAQRLGIPYAIKVRGTDLHGLPSSGARRRLTALALRDAAAVVAVSGNLAAIARELGAQDSRIHILHNGIDADRFAILPRDEARLRLNLDANRAVILFVGSLLPVKGLDVLLDALKRLLAARPNPPLLLAMAGEGPLRPMIEGRLAAEGLAGDARLLGHVGREELALWLNAADVLTLPSRNEGCPNVVMEALASGTPVVASRVGAAPDLLDEGAGIIVPREDAAALASALARALDAKWDRRAIRAKVEGMSWEANAQKLHSILSSLAASQ